MFTVVDLYGELGGKSTSFMNDHETLGVQVNVNPCVSCPVFFPGNKQPINVRRVIMRQLVTIFLPTLQTGQLGVS